MGITKIDNLFSILLSTNYQQINNMYLSKHNYGHNLKGGGQCGINTLYCLPVFFKTRVPPVSILIFDFYAQESNKIITRHLLQLISLTTLPLLQIFLSQSQYFKSILMILTRDQSKYLISFYVSLRRQDCCSLSIFQKSILKMFTQIEFMTFYLVVTREIYNSIFSLYQKFAIQIFIKTKTL